MPHDCGARLKDGSFTCEAPPIFGDHLLVTASGQKRMRATLAVGVTSIHVPPSQPAATLASTPNDLRIIVRAIRQHVSTTVFDQPRRLQVSRCLRTSETRCPLQTSLPQSSRNGEHYRVGCNPSEVCLRMCFAPPIGCRKG
jgi:hypothetical protein